MSDPHDPPSDPHAELLALTRAVRGLAELDRLTGVLTTPVPLRAPSAPEDAHEPIPATRPPREGAPERPAAVAPPAPARPAPTPPRAPDLGAATRALPQAGPQAGPQAPSALPLAQRRAHNEAELHALADRLAGCTRCRLAEGRTNLVFGQGDAAAELVFVGEGPGYHEDMQGMAFVGPSGALLTKMINAMGYRREEVFICNVVKCRPPRNRNPQPDEMGTCLPFLREQLEIIRPRAICALGRTAAIGLGLIGVDDSLGRHRGRLLDWRLGEATIPTVLTYHPAYLLRSPQEKGKAWKDLQLLFPLLERRSPERIEE